MAKILTNTQVEEYNKNGFLAVKNVFTSSEVKDLQDVTDEFVDRSRNLKESNDDFDIDLKAGHSSTTPKLRRIMSPDKHHPVYERANKNPKLLDIIEQLIGPNIRKIHQK